MRRDYLATGESVPEQGMDAVQRQQMKERHQRSLSHFGYAPESLFWGSRGVQKVRFKALAGIGIAAGDSLLDVGCGFADLYSWLASHDLPVTYTGIDLSPEILDRAKELNPELQLLQGEIFDFDWPPQTFDWVFLSGTLNWDLKDEGEHVRRVIRRMFRLCRSGVAFNLLDARDFDARHLVELSAYEPEEMLAFCSQMTPDCCLRSDYLGGDFTIYMRPVAGNAV
ncbi:MAG TPA: class I SAM-dependent methyltransferase [Mariprofundaceae bacterium]|nr:class I SAM-dependent methyltransferase [Mariprofundaceae bacterium]